MKATWDADNFSYVIDGAEVDALVAKGASSAIANEFDASIRVNFDRLMAGQVSAQEAYQTMKRDVKYLHMAQAALARGGFENMRPQDYARVEQIVESQWSGVEGRFPGLRAFFEDIARGRYGRTSLSSGVLSRGGQYPGAGRATYENERLAARMESTRLEAKRVRGFLDACEDCVAWAALGWIPADLMLEEYPVGSSRCGGYCGCTIVTRVAQGSIKIPQAAKAAVATAVAIAALRYAARTPLLRLQADSIWDTVFRYLAKGNVSYNKIISQVNWGKMPGDFTREQIEILAPVQQHPFKPAGKPVGASIELDPQISALRSVIDSLDAVHGDGNLEKIDVSLLYGGLRRNKFLAGQYVSDQKPHMKIHPQGPIPGLSLLHETGHWIEDKALNPTALSDAALESAGRLDRAIQRSNAVKTLKRYQDFAIARKMVPGVELRPRPFQKPKRLRYKIDGEYVSYLLRREELWARAYSQYIAIRSGNEQLLAELASQLFFHSHTAIGGPSEDSGLHYFPQWTSSDFAPIADEFDKLFTSLGWLKNS